LSFWQQAIPEAKYLFVYRSPWEVVDSLYRRGDEIFQNAPILALNMWRIYNKKLLNFYREYSDRCVLVNTHVIIQDPIKLVEAINYKLNIHLGYPNSSLYKVELLRQEAVNSYYYFFIQKFFPDILQLFDDLNANADLTESVPVLTNYMTDSFFQDWARSRQLKLAQNQIAELTEHKLWFAQQLENSQNQIAELTEHKLWFAQQLDILNQELLKVTSSLEQLQIELRNTQVDLSRTQLRYNHLKARLNVKQSKLLETRSQLKEKKLQLQGIRQDLKYTKETIEAMKSSKFWKLRNAWFKLRR
jgi:hypothetical protein